MSVVDKEGDHDNDDEDYVDKEVEGNDDDGEEHNHDN